VGDGQQAQRRRGQEIGPRELNDPAYEPHHTPRRGKKERQEGRGGGQTKEDHQPSVQARPIRPRSARSEGRAQRLKCVSPATRRKAPLPGGGKLFPDYLNCGPVQPRGAPAHLLLEMAFYSRVEQGEHDAKDAGVGIETANGDSVDFSSPQLADLRRRETVPSQFIENQVPFDLRDQEFGVGRPRGAAFLLQYPTRERALGIHIAREYPARKSPRIALNAPDKIRRRLKGALQVDNQKGAVRLHGSASLTQFPAFCSSGIDLMPRSDGPPLWANCAPKAGSAVKGCMHNTPRDSAKPVEPTSQTPSTGASNPRDIRNERPGPGSVSAGTPDGGGNAKATGAGGSSRGSRRKGA
jgi:hypothetical protein